MTHRNKYLKIFFIAVLFGVLFFVGWLIGKQKSSIIITDNGIIETREIKTIRTIDQITPIPANLKNSSKIDTSYQLFEAGNYPNSVILIGDVVAYSTDNNIELNINTSDQQKEFHAKCTINNNTKYNLQRSEITKTEKGYVLTFVKTPLLRSLNTDVTLTITMQYDTTVMDYDSFNNICLEVNELT